jgi:hypothetical protein
MDKMIKSKTRKGYFKVTMIGSQEGYNKGDSKGELTIKAFKSAPKCAICLEGKIDHVFIPCGHMCSCEGCSNAIMNPGTVNAYRKWGGAECPICTKKIKDSLFVGE